MNYFIVYREIQQLARKQITFFTILEYFYFSLTFMERAATTDQPYIRITLQKFLKNSKKTSSHKNVIEIDQNEYSKTTQKQKKKQNFLESGMISHSHNNSLQFYESSQKDKQIIQGFSQKYSEFVNKIKFYNQSRLKTMEPLKIDKPQQGKNNYKDIYEQRIYKKAMQQKQKLYPFMQKRSKTQHEIKGIIVKNANNNAHIEQMNNLTTFSPLDIKLSNSHSQQEDLLQEQRLKQKRFLIKTANRKMLRRQFGSNHSVSVNENKIKVQQRRMIRKKSQTRTSDPLQTQLKLAQQTIIQNRRLVPSMGVLKSKYKSQQMRQKLKIKFSKYKFFDQDNQKIKYHTTNTSQQKCRNNSNVQQTKKSFQFLKLSKQGLRGWDLPTEKEAPTNLNININDFQQF